MKKRRRLNPKRRLAKAIVRAQDRDLARNSTLALLGAGPRDYSMRRLREKYGERYRAWFPLTEQDKINRLKALGLVFSNGMIICPRSGVGFPVKD